LLLDTLPRAEEDPRMTQTSPSAFSFFDSPPPTPGTERFDVLYERQGVTIERITSSGSQPAAEYCQTEDEWVMLLRGQAEMMIRNQCITLHEGQSICLPARTPHRVVSTSENALWLAVHVSR
jgi:cupin 2 domain-containing protein